MVYRKKLMIGLAVAAAAFATVFAMAATLTVGSNSLGAGSADVASCDGNGVDHTYDTAYAASISGYRVTSVEVTGIAAACDGYDMKVTLIDSSDASLVELTDTVGATGTETLPVGGSVQAASVEDIAVVISE